MDLPDSRPNYAATSRQQNSVSQQRKKSDDLLAWQAAGKPTARRNFLRPSINVDTEPGDSYPWPAMECLMPLRPRLRDHRRAVDRGSGTLLGTLDRPAGERLSDRYGNGRVALTVLIGALATGGMPLPGTVGYHLRNGDCVSTGSATADYTLRVIALIVSCGAGAGILGRPMPLVADARNLTAASDDKDRRNAAGVRPSSLLRSAFAFAPLSDVSSMVTARRTYDGTGAATTALAIFLDGYAFAVIREWTTYGRAQPSACGRSASPPAGDSWPASAQTRCWELLQNHGLHGSGKNSVAALNNRAAILDSLHRRASQARPP